MLCPAAYGIHGTSVFTIETSALATIVSLSVAELFAGFGSVTPPGAATVAVLASVPLADALRVAGTVKVTEPSAGRFTDALMLPLPDAGHTPPPVPTHVQV